MLRREIRGEEEIPGYSDVVTEYSKIHSSHFTILGSVISLGRRVFCVFFVVI